MAALSLQLSLSLSEESCRSSASTFSFYSRHETNYSMRETYGEFEIVIRERQSQKGENLKRKRGESREIIDEKQQ